MTLSAVPIPIPYPTRYNTPMSHVSRHQFLLLGTATLLLAAVFRLIALQDIPPGLSQDEVLNAGMVPFILEGNHALFFRQGYGHEPLFHYWTIPFQRLFGSNVLGIRLPAVYLGMFLIALTMRWARREFGSVTAVVTGVGLGISWWPIIFSRVGIRPIFAPLLFVATAWFWPRRPWLAGVCLGLSYYSYTGARIAFLIPLLFIAYLLMIRRWLVNSNTLVPWLRSALIVLVVSSALYLPLGLTLRADPTLQQRIDQLAGPLDALIQGDVRPVLESTLATLGVFSFTGDPRWTYTLPGRPLFDPLTTLLFYGGLWVALSRLRQPRFAWLLIWFGVTLIPSALSPQAPSTVRLVGALPVVYVFPGLAAAWLWQKRPAHPLTHRLARTKLLASGFILILALNLFLSLRDGFVRWPQALETRLKYQSVLLDIGRYWEHEQGDSLVIADSFYEPIDDESLRHTLGYDPGARWIQTGAQVAGALVIPGDGSRNYLFVPEFAPPSVDLLRAANISQKPLYRSQSEPSFAVYPLLTTPNPPPIRSMITLDNRITLLGYEIFPMSPKQPLRLITMWRVEAPLPSDLTVFVHLLANDNTPIAAQHDGFDAAPETVIAGDTIIQRHLLPVDGLRPDTRYTLLLGLYEQRNGRRLTHSGEPADHIILREDLIFDGK